MILGDMISTNRKQINWGYKNLARANDISKITALFISKLKTSLTTILSDNLTTTLVIDKDNNDDKDSGSRTIENWVKFKIFEVSSFLSSASKLAYT